MKEGWKCAKLGSLCSVRRDSGQHTNMAYIGLEHIASEKGKLITIVSTENVIGSTNLFSRGDVLYGKLRPYLKKVVVAETEGCCSTEILPIKCGEHILPDFLKYWFLEDNVSNRINDTCGGCRMPRANMKQVFMFDFYYPSLSEQQRIVDILDAEFAKIDALKENAEKNLQNAKDLFQAVLRKELEPKENWSRTTLKDACKNLFAGGDAPKDAMSKEKSDLFSIPIISNGIGANSLYGYTNHPRVVEKSVTISARGTIGYVALQEEPFFPIVRLIVAIPRDDIRAEFLRYALQGVNFHHEGAAIPQLTVPMVRDIPVDFPDINEQDRIVSDLDKLSCLCNALRDHYTQINLLCGDLKQALLRKAFNGEL